MSAMRNILLTIAYDGTAYSGWQVQPNCPTIQGTIETQLARMTQKPSRLRAAGRTDAGVHAEGQLAAFHTDSRFSCADFMRGLNAMTPPTIEIRAAKEVPLEFNPRHDCAGKHYRYTIHNAREMPPLLRQRAHHIRAPLDLLAMAQAGQTLVGRHDFGAFRAADCERLTTIRTLYRCTVSKSDTLVLLDVEGTAFLKHMVRVIAGTLCDVGLGRRDPSHIVHLLNNPDRSQAGMTAPAHGLTLVEVLMSELP